MANSLPVQNMTNVLPFVWYRCFCVWLYSKTTASGVGGGGSDAAATTAAAATGGSEAGSREGRERGASDLQSSWTHHSTPQMNVAMTRPAATLPTYADRRLQQLRTDANKNDDMHRFKYSHQPLFVSLSLSRSLCTFHSSSVVHF